MAKWLPPRLVVDASVAARAGKVGETPSARACRDFLIALMANSYRIAFSEHLREEWRNHASPFAERWRAQMVGKRGRVEFHTLDFHELQEFVVDMAIAKKKGQNPEGLPPRGIGAGHGSPSRFT